MASDRDTLAEHLDAVAQRGHGQTFLAPFFRGLVDLVLAAGWHPPAREPENPRDLTRKWRDASKAARKAEHHWPADCLAEAAAILDDIPVDWRPPAREITTAAQADALPVGTILFHVDCPDPDPCIWRRACSPSEVEDEIDGGTFDHIHWAAWGDEEERYDGEDLEGHADCGGPLLAVYVPTEEAGRG